ncbi:hypothetical protein ACWEQC_06935 [Streptomyces shenzhenensis]
MKRRKHHGKEQTYNDRVFVVRYTRPFGTRETGEFSTSDRRQAYRQARRWASLGRLISFTRHVGAGRWQDLTASVTGEVGA